MTKHNPLRELSRSGVSVWYDNISRSLIRSGALKRLIDEDGLTGVTSNPTIFEKAIGSSHDYDDAIRELAKRGKGAQEIFESLAIEDIRAAADLFKPVWDSTGGADGFVSLELPPALARDGKGSLKEAVRLFSAVDRPNLMIKIPGTSEGLEAIEGAIAEGIPVNVTLLFAQRRYAEVVSAYLRGLERRAAHHKDLSRVASVASFFVSRVDGSVDKALEARVASGEPCRDLLGKAAIANAKLAYQIFKREFGTPRWKALARAGARPQRLLWASTSTKNPAYRDVLYCEELIGLDTVNTMPPATVEAFRDHGVCRPSLEESVDQAKSAWTRLGSLVDLPRIERELEQDGLKSFEKSFETLLGQIAAKRELIEAGAGVVEQGLGELERALFSSRLWSKDPSLWKQDREHQKLIKNSLGWLSGPEAMAASLGSIRGFVAQARAEFDEAVVLGMGGSSLACEVFRRCFPAAPGHPKLSVLDTTDPGSVLALRRRLDLKRTLFIVSSKSGSTIEPNAFLEFFWAEAQKALGAGEAGRRFVAITDPGSSLETLARRRGFRKTFLNAPDIGGRFSALSYFGLVPAGLMGVDLERLLGWARQAARMCSPERPSSESLALRLGAALGRHAALGRDKLTLSLSPAVESLGLWIEQLVAESTGKEGKGIVPVFGEPLGAPESYVGDRLFVRVELPDSPDREAAERLDALERAGHPVFTLPLNDPYELGAQFFVWEVAVAAACQLLGVNPFDQPDVQAAKDQTKSLLGSMEKGVLPRESPAFRAGGWAAFGDPALETLFPDRPDRPLSDALAAQLARLKPADYFAVLAFVDPNEDNARALSQLQKTLRRLTRSAVLVQFGPRYLHSTGQLFKGGGDNGVFLMLVEAEGSGEPTAPGQGTTFGVLMRAQARGDFAALRERGRRVLLLELGAPGSQPMQALLNAAASLSEKCPS